MEQNNKNKGGRPRGKDVDDPRRLFIATQIQIIRGEKLFPHYDKNGEMSMRRPTLDDVQKALQAVAPFVVSKVAASKKVSTAVPAAALDADSEGDETTAGFAIDFDLDAPSVGDSAISSESIPE